VVQVKNRKNKKIAVTFIVAGTLAVVGVHLLEPNVKRKLKV
jgi:hypothetical protein